MKSLEEKALDILNLDGKWSHLFTFGNPSKPYPTNFENDLSKVILGLTSKTIEVEKIKAQIDAINEFCKEHYLYGGRFHKDFIEKLKNQLKELENERDNDTRNV
jgi:hypothetical protein